MSKKPKTETKPAPKTINQDGEETSTMPATLSQQAMASIGAGGLPAGFKVAKKVTLSQLKQRDGVPVYIKVLTPMRLATAIKDRGDGKPKMEPPTLVNVIDLTDGREKQYIVNAVLKSIFEEQYKGDAYIGKSFGINSLPKEEGKRHKPLEVIELVED